MSEEKKNYLAYDIMYPYFKELFNRFAEKYGIRYIQMNTNRKFLDSLNWIDNIYPTEVSIQTQKMISDIIKAEKFSDMEIVMPYLLEAKILRDRDIWKLEVEMISHAPRNAGNKFETILKNAKQMMENYNSTEKWQTEEVLSQIYPKGMEKIITEYNFEPSFDQVFRFPNTCKKSPKKKGKKSKKKSR